MPECPLNDPPTDTRLTPSSSTNVRATGPRGGRRSRSAQLFKSPRVERDRHRSNGNVQQERGTGRFTTYESVRRQREEPALIESELADAERDGTTAVVISHHAPTPRSIAPKFGESTLNPAFASNLEPVIAR